MKSFSLLLCLVLLTGFVSMAIEYHGFVEVAKYPKGKEIKSEFGPVKSPSVADGYNDIGIVKVNYAQFDGYLKEQIKDHSHKTMYDIRDGRYKILEEKGFAYRVFRASYRSSYVNGRGGGQESAGDVLITGNLIAFRYV